MVLIATPLQDIVCPVVYIEHSANLPDFLGEATAQIGEHYARTLLPEFTLYKYAAITSNLVNEVKALASSENSAKYPITFAGDLVQTLAELPDPGKALTRRLKNAIKSRKPCEPKKQDPVFKSLLPSKGLSTLELAEKSGTAFILSEPAIASTEGRFNGDKQDGLLRALFADLDIHIEPSTSPFIINNEEKNSKLAKLRFKPRAHTPPSSAKPFPSALQLLLGDNQAAGQLLPPPHSVFLSESILLETKNTTICPKETSFSLLNAQSGKLLESSAREQRRTSLPLLPPAASQLRQITLSTDSNALKYAWEPQKRADNKLDASTKRKLPAVLLSSASDAAASSAPRVQKKKRRKLLVEDQTNNSVAEIEEDILVPLEVPLLPEHLKAAAVPPPPLFPLAAFPELLNLPPGATDLALGFITKTPIKNNTDTATAEDNAKSEGMKTRRGITERGSNSIRNIEACSLLWDLVANEMAPAGESLLLSPISIAESGITAALHALHFSPSADTVVGADSNSLAVVGLFDKILQECGVMKQSTGSLALVLDWSLSTHQASLRNSELLETCRRVKDVFVDGCVKKKKKTLEPFCSSTGKVVLSSLSAPFSLHNLESKSEISLITSPSSFDGSVVPAALGDGTLAATPCTNNYMRPAAAAAREADDVPPAKRLRLENDGSTAVPPAVPGGLGYFMQLHNKHNSYSGVHGAAAGAGAAAAAVDGNGTKTTTFRNKSTSSMSDGLSDFLQPANSVQTVTVSLPSSHTNVLLCLQKADAALLATVPPQFLPPGVTAQDFPELDHVNTALRSINASNVSFPAAGAAGKMPVLRMLAGVAIFRQTAKLVIHHGIRAAHMYFSSSVQELPGICDEKNNSSKKKNVSIAQVLAEVASRVESGQEEDHPKHTALRQTLMTINTLSTGSKILIIGDPKSFFTLYSVIYAAGLRPCHLDREGQLLSNTNGDATTSSREKEKAAVFAEAVMHACTVADCILAACELVLIAFSSVHTREMLLHSFQHVVIYVSEPGVQQQVQEGLRLPVESASAAVVASTTQPACSVTVLAVQTEPLVDSFSPHVEEEEPRIPSLIPSKQQIPPAAAEISLKAAVPTGPTPDWPLVLSNSTLRPVKSRRELYESIITLENEGTVIVERAMQHLDMILSPTAALIITTEEAAAATTAGGSGPDFELFVQHITPIFERIGRAFSKLHLVCEGSTAFRAQLLCGHPRLVSAAARCNLTLQCDVTCDATATSLTARSIATSYLQEWKNRRRSSGRQNLFYSIGDPPSQVEIFLAAVPSLNPHSAALLAGCGLTLQQLFSLDTLITSSGGGKVPAVLGLVPTHSMELFNECCSAGRALGGGGGGEILLAGAATSMPMPPRLAPHHAPPATVHRHPIAAIVDDLPESLDEFMKPSVSVAAPVHAPGGRGRDVGARDNNPGGFSSAGNGSADIMPAPSWCGPQLGTSDYLEYASVQLHRHHHQPRYYSEYEEQQEYQPCHPYWQQMHQHQQPGMYQGEELDEFGVPLDPVASWAALGREDEDAQHSFQQQQQQQWQGYGIVYNDAVNHAIPDEQDAVSGYVPPWIEGGMPLPGLAPTTRLQAPRQPPHHNFHHRLQQQPTQPTRPTRAALVNDDRFSDVSSFQYQHYPQQQQRPFAAPVPPQSFRGGPAGDGGGGARGYTAAALNRQQQQHSASMWQALSTAPGNTANTAITGAGLSGADYMKRKWGGGRGTRRGGGGGRGGKGRKFSSRTQRQW